MFKTWNGDSKVMPFVTVLELSLYTVDFINYMLSLLRLSYANKLAIIVIFFPNYLIIIVMQKPTWEVPCVMLLQTQDWYSTERSYTVLHKDSWKTEKQKQDIIVIFLKSIWISFCFCLLNLISYVPHFQKVMGTILST